jgi:uncharacterized membrane protein
MNASLRKLLRYVFVGALSLVPLVFVLIVVNFLKNIGVSAYFKLNDYTNSLGVTIILIIAVLVLFAIIGYSLERYGKSFIVSLLDKTFESIPAIRTVYSVSRKVANMFSGSENNGKKEVVLVEYPKDDVWVPAYVLNRHANINVLFIPTSPNPTSGYTVLVDDAKLIRTTLSLEEASTFIISMGADFSKRDEIVEKINASHRTHQS